MRLTTGIRKLLLLLLVTGPALAQSTQINLQTQVRGILPVANGGTGATPSAADMTLISSAVGIAGYSVIPNCAADGAHMVTYSTSTHTYSCTALSAAIFPGTTGVVFNTSTTGTRNANFHDIVNLWSGCVAGYLAFDGSCSTSTGSGITSIGITTANGVSGTSSGGSTPNLTITLGAITPTSIQLPGGGPAVTAPTGNGDRFVTSLSHTPPASTTIAEYDPLGNVLPSAVLLGDMARYSGTTPFTAAQTFNVGGISYNNWIVLPSAAATSSVNVNSPQFLTAGNYWTGSASTQDQWFWTTILGTGANPTSTYTLGHNGSTGTATISIPFPISVASCTGCGGGGGSAVGPLGTLQAAGVAGAFAAATTNNVNLALGSSRGIYGAGDSIMCNTGASSQAIGNYPNQNGFFNLLAPIMGGPANNQCNPGDQAADTNYKFAWRSLNPQGGGIDPVVVIEDFTNDTVNYLGNANKQNIAKRALQGMLVRAGIPVANTKFAQSCTLAGGMAADTTTEFAAMGVTSTTSGATASCVINAPKAGDTLYACYKIIDASTGTFTVQVDAGAAVADEFSGSTTWTTAGDGGAAILTQNGMTQSVVCNRLTNGGAGYSAGNHTILFTATTAGTVFPRMVAAAPVASTTLNPPVIAVSPNQQQVGSAGQPYTATYAGFMSTIVTNLNTDGLFAQFADTSNALLNDPQCGNGVQATMFTNCYADNIHPNSNFATGHSGHTVMSNTILALIPSARVLGVTAWNRNQPATMFQANPAVSSPIVGWTNINYYNLVPTAGQWGAGLSFQAANGQFSGIGWLSNTGMTFISPAGAGVAAAWCPTAGNGLISPIPPALTSCFMYIGNGTVNFFGGSSIANGTTIQSGLVATGTNTQILVPGVFKSTNVSLAGQANSGPWAVGIATSTTNISTGCWTWMAAVWDAVLGTPGNTGPCLKGVPVSPTPGGSKGQIYLTLDPGAFQGGLDLSLTNLTNHLKVADATTFNATTSLTTPLVTATNVNAATGVTGSTVTATGFLVSNGVSTLGTNLSNSTGFQVTSTAGCTITTGAIGNTCNVTVTLPVTEPDTLYTVRGCEVTGASVGPVVMADISSKSTTTFVVPEVALSTTASGGGTVVCQVSH